MGRDEQRAGAAPEVLLEPLDRPDVEVVGGLVEEHQVRVRDHEPRERRPRLLAARERRRRAEPLVAREPEAGQRLVDPLVERVAAEDVEPVLEVRVAGRPGLAPVLERRELLGHPLEVRGAVADRGPQVRRGHERLVEVRLLAEQPERQPALAARPSRGPARRGPDTIRSSVVLPAPFGPDEAHPLARRDRRRSTWSRMTNVPISRTTPSRRTRLTRRPPARRCRPARPLDARRRPPSSARSWRSPRAASSVVRPSAPSPSSSTQRRPRRPVGRRPGVASSSRAASPPRVAAPRAGAGTTSRSASRGCRRRSAGSAARSAGTARRCAGRRRAAPASRRRRRAPCSRRSSCRAARPPRRGSRGCAATGRARRAGGASRADRSGWSFERHSASSA